MRAIFKTLEPAINIPEEPDSATMLVEIAFAIMKFGYYRDGEISEAIMEQAIHACVGYLLQTLPDELAAS